MSVAKVIEMSAGSKEDFEDAIKEGIAKAKKTVNDIQGAWIKEQKVAIDNGKIQEFHGDLKVSFRVG